MNTEALNSVSTETLAVLSTVACDWGTVITENTDKIRVR